MDEMDNDCISYHSSRHINIHDIYDQISYHRLLIKYQVDNIVIIVMRWRYIILYNAMKYSYFVNFKVYIGPMAYQ